MLSDELLRMTKPGVVIVNPARQQILGETVLIELLHFGHVGSFAAGVFNDEPLPGDQPLRQLTMSS